MKKSVKIISVIIALVSVLSLMGIVAFATETEEIPENGITAEAPEMAVAEAPEETAVTADSSTKTKAIVAGAVIAIVAGIGAIAMAIAINGASQGIARQPEAAGNIRTNVMLGLVFIETAIIYALIIAILVIFVL